MTPVLSLCNSLSMNRQVFVPGGGSGCGHRGRGVLTVSQILRPDTRPPSAPPPHQLAVTQTLYLQTTRESPKKNREVKHTTNNPQAPSTHEQQETRTKCTKQSTQENHWVQHFQKQSYAPQITRKAQPNNENKSNLTWDSAPAASDAKDDGRVSLKLERKRFSLCTSIPSQSTIQMWWYFQTKTWKTFHKSSLKKSKTKQK